MGLLGNRGTQNKEVEKKKVNCPALTDWASATSATLELLASTAMLAFTCGILFMYSSMLLAEA
ncbi:MAG: hypothetical protein QW478_13050 [Candidatus Micrarchaeaceae archaeon]